MQRQGGETSPPDQQEGGAMGDLSSDSLSRASCCMLCSSQLYSAGFNVYQARTYHGEKTFYDKLIQLTNYSATMPRLASDCLCSVCATLLSQIDQLEFQLNDLVSQIRSLFHKMVRAQLEAAGRQGEPQQQPQQQQQQQHPPGLPGGAAGIPSSDLPAGPAAFPAQVKTEPQSVEQPQPTHTPSFFDKKPAAKENGESPAAVAVTAEPTGGPSWPVVPTPTSSGSAGDSPFSLGHFLAPQPAVNTAGDFTDKFVREVASEDVYRFQCVLCSRLADCAEAIRQHVRRDHPGADRISFPGSGGRRGASRPAAASVSKSSASVGTPGGKVPRSISASAAAMAQNIADRAFVCIGCDKAFGCEAFLTRHVTAQHCGRMFGCQFCGKEFSRSDKKVRHERSHTGERPFSCGFCGKAFSRRDKCTVHEKSHTKHRPLECQRCGEMMFTTAAYASHRQRCSDDAQGTGPLWQATPAAVAVTPVSQPVDGGDA